MSNKYSISIISIAYMLSASFTAEAAPQCSLKTLKGTYIYYTSNSTNNKWYFEAGQEIYDGKGNIQNTSTNSQGETIKTQGTYTMDSTCVGIATYRDSGESYVIYTSPKGDYFTWASTTPSDLAAGGETRVTTSLTPKYSLKTLSGTYLYSQQGSNSGKRYTESGKDLFDGSGALVNVYTRNTTHPVVTRGTYTMDENCIGKATYTGTGDSYVIYTGPKGNHLQVIAESSQSSEFSIAPEYRVSRALIGVPNPVP